MAGAVEIMDTKLMLSAFFTLFLAEMGDRTQFAALALALLLAVVFADIAGRYLPELVLRRTAAVLCIAMGVWMWWR